MADLMGAAGTNPNPGQSGGGGGRRANSPAPHRVLYLM
jgi:hypothetical protein